MVRSSFTHPWHSKGCLWGAALAYSKKLAPPIVAAAVTTIVLTNFSIVQLVARGEGASFHLFGSIWPIVLASTVAVVLVMSFLYHALLEVVGELERGEKTAQKFATHDSLTGLPNRVLLQQQLDQAIGRRRRGGENFALLMLDLDRFKKINDTLGHQAGDELLRQVAQRLQSVVRDTDTVARLGGDEFAILQCNPKQNGDVRRLCRRITGTLGAPYTLGEREAEIGVSIGAILASQNLALASEYMRKADITMYRAKAEGRNCYRLFSEKMDAEVQRRSLIEDKLRAALQNRKGLSVHYQPQISGTGSIVGVEALLRWTDPDLGEIPPVEIIPIAEECGLINRLGEFVFREGCRAAKRWPTLFVGVNLSPLQFTRAADLPMKLKAIALAEGVSCAQMELEITESLFLEQGQSCEEAIDRLRSEGFRIALDDFGTGYSSLSYLRRFNVDKIKLDKSFIDEARIQESVAIIRAAVALGHAMDLEVVAEGIATKEQEALALEAGCDAVQGHLYAPAMPVALMDEYLEKAGVLAVAA
jgi:diguanylate cyclase (GGDEF)-like protein